MKGLLYLKTVSNTVCTDSTNTSTHILPQRRVIASKQKNNKNENFGPNVLEIFHHSADFGTCHLCCFFSLYKLRLLLQRIQHTGGIFTEQVLPGPSSVHRDQILPRCVYNSIFFSTAATTRAVVTAFFPEPRTSGCPLSFLFMSCSSSLDL